MAIDLKNQTPKNTLPANGVIFGADDPNSTSPSTYTKSALINPNTVTSVSGGTTGLTPAVPTSGDVVISGTLAVANGGTGVTTKTGTGNVVLSDNPTLVAPVLGQPASGDLTNCTDLPLTTGITGVLDETNGGTGQSSYTIGDLLYASSTTALSKLPDAATGNALISGGVGAPPSWGKVGLTTHVSGTLPVANGGTGVTTLPALQVAVLPSQGGNSGKFLTTNGSTAAWDVSRGDIEYYTNIAALRGVTPTSGKFVEVGGYYTGGDGGGGQFVGVTEPAVFTGSISGSGIFATLTVTAVQSGSLYPGMLLSDAGGGVLVGTTLSRQTSGTIGGVGTYLVDLPSAAAEFIGSINGTALTVLSGSVTGAIAANQELGGPRLPTPYFSNGNNSPYSPAPAILSGSGTSWTLSSSYGTSFLTNFPITSNFPVSSRTMTGKFVDDGGMIFVPTGGDGSSAWIRVPGENINVKWFGAKGIGSGFDDQPAVSAAVNYLFSSYKNTLYFPDGDFYFAKPVEVFCDRGISLRIIGTSLAGMGQFRPGGTRISAPSGASFTGYIEGNVLTASSITGTIAIGQSVIGTGIATSANPLVTTATIIANGPSPNTYILDNYQNVPSASPISMVSGVISFIFNKRTRFVTFFSCEIENIDFRGGSASTGSLAGIANLTSGGPARLFNVYNCNFTGFRKAGIMSDSRKSEAYFTATIDNGAGGAGNILTVTNCQGKIELGQYIVATGVAAQTSITGYLTGTGGNGTYTISASLNLSSRTMASGFNAGYGSTGIGQVNIKGCSLIGNSYGVWSVGNQALQGLNFDGNVCEANTLGGVYSENGGIGAGYQITNNLLEQQPNAINISVSLGVGIIARNYFESNNDYVISVVNQASASICTIGPNFYQSVTDKKIRLSGGTITMLDNPNLISTGAAKLDIRLSKPGTSLQCSGILYPENWDNMIMANLASAQIPSNVAPAVLDSPSYVQFPSPTFATGTYEQTPMGFANYATFSTDLTTDPRSNTAISLVANQAVVAVCLARVQSGSPALTLRVHRNSDNALIASSFGNSASTTFIQTGQWFLVVAAAKTLVSSGGLTSIRWGVTGGQMDVTQTYTYKIADTTASVSPLYMYLPYISPLYGQSTYDPGNLIDGDGVTTTLTVTGAAVGDLVQSVSFSQPLQGITVTGWVSATDTVSVRFQNETGGAIDLASGTLRATVIKV